MGRLSQLYWFINADPIPTDYEMACQYSHIAKTDEIKEIRRQALKATRLNSKTLSLFDCYDSKQT